MLCSDKCKLHLGKKNQMHGYGSQILLGVSACEKGLGYSGLLVKHKKVVGFSAIWGCINRSIQSQSQEVMVLFSSPLVRNIVPNFESSPFKRYMLKLE